MIKFSHNQNGGMKTSSFVGTRTEKSRLVKGFSGKKDELHLFQVLRDMSANDKTRAERLSKTKILKGSAEFRWYHETHASS